MDTLFKEDFEISLPPQFDLAGKIGGASVKRLKHPAKRMMVKGNEFSERQIKGVFLRPHDEEREIAAIPRKTKIDISTQEILQHPSASKLAEFKINCEPGVWIKPQPEDVGNLDINEFKSILSDISSSWHGAFSFREEKIDGDIIIQTGLRKPQIGAIHAALGHWTASTSPATIVMPTGTGKTETMLALLVAAQIKRLLVIVPSDALRTQISEKFLGLGILKDCSCVAQSAKLPVVATIDKIPKTTDEIEDIFSRANVVVTTMAAVAQADTSAQLKMAELTTHLFVDEAHHIGAKTWKEFKAHFANSLILQFTATPYRTDGRHIDGKFIYVYPLAKAYVEGYFKKIHFIPVHGLDREDADEKIVNMVKNTLIQDDNMGCKHLAMARCRTIETANKLLSIYSRIMPEFNPILLHSKKTSKYKSEALRKLRAKESRVIVCVDMLGEGFDLPDLKIAALHDKHKSEAITVQFVGRFTRARKDLGDATIIADAFAKGIRESLQALYTEDADWNGILEGLGTRNTAREERHQEVLGGFDDLPTNFPLDQLRPRLGSVVYETSCERWNPKRIEDAYPSGSIVDGPSINNKENLAIFVKREDEKLKWTNMKQPVNRSYHLYACHWDYERKLLFITSSNTGDLHTKLAEMIGGPDVKRIRGERVYRVLDGYKRLMLSHLGLSEALRKPIRYSQFMGIDIAPVLTDDPANRGRMKTNIFGQGYNHRGKSTIGCSSKGKIWSYETANGFSGWMKWCEEIGEKLQDSTITTDGILRRLVMPTKQTSMPTKHATAINWPESALYDQDDKVSFVFDDQEIPIYDCDIQITSQITGKEIGIRIGNGVRYCDLTMTLNEAGAHYGGNINCCVYINKKELDLVDWFKEDPPHIYFADGDMLLGSELLKLPDDHIPAFDPNRLIVQNWTGVDIKKESQGLTKDPTSIQRKVIDNLINNGNYDLIFDDDGSGESADIVAIRRSGDTLMVDMFHCKYSSATKPSARVADLYDVCGQTQKSIRWRERPDLLLDRLRTRETMSIRKYGVSRIEKGAYTDLTNWHNRWREFNYLYEMTAVQPGYSKSEAIRQQDKGQFELLAATQSLLMDTYAIPFSFQCSA